ncbi:MAG: hypothetical protein VZR24_21090, partial [Butyrivibrio hungatei]|nr:hypothetical protein [Butyrivibrio hungatei]
ESRSENFAFARNLSSAFAAFSASTFFTVISVCPMLLVNLMFAASPAVTVTSPLEVETETPSIFVSVVPFVGVCSVTVYIAVNQPVLLYKVIFL